MGWEQNKQVVVCVLNRAIVILPDRDVDLGPIQDDERIISGIVKSSSGQVSNEAYKMKASDPRLAGMVAGKPWVSGK